MRVFLTILLVLVACSDDEPGPKGPFHDPWTVMPSTELAEVRGFRVVRGIVHSHSPYSHDACDDDPFPDGARNEACFQDVRRGMCATRQDFVFLTDHDDLFAYHEYPDVLLFAPGDQLIERDGATVANRVDCGDGHSVVLAAGTESEMMPIGLEHHIGATPAERNVAYNAPAPDGIAPLQGAGALVFLQHTEGWPITNIVDWPIDGIEIYNLHANLEDNLGDVVIAALELVANPEKMPVPELALLTFFEENEADLERWAAAAAVKRLAGALASDVHQNALSGESTDGERLDSFRRIMHWFSNYVLIPAGEPIDDRVIKDAIAEGRLYGGFDHLGYPIGFEFYARAGDSVVEMGGATGSDESVELVLTAPTLFRRDPRTPAPEMHTRILKANAGAWQVVAEGEGDLTTEVGPGAYRAEVGLVPYHLEEWLGENPETYFVEYPWVYANPIWVGAY
jgi:hypothetical protein